MTSPGPTRSGQAGLRPPLTPTPRALPTQGIGSGFLWPTDTPSPLGTRMGTQSSQCRVCGSPHRLMIPQDSQGGGGGEACGALVRHVYPSTAAPRIQTPTCLPSRTLYFSEWEAGPAELPSRDADPQQGSPCLGCLPGSTPRGCPPPVPGPGQPSPLCASWASARR